MVRQYMNYSELSGPDINDAMNMDHVGNAIDTLLMITNHLHGEDHYQGTQDEIDKLMVFDIQLATAQSLCSIAKTLAGLHRDLAERRI